MTKSLVLGFFDGVHIAHRTVIKSALDYSDECVLITLKNFPSKSNYIFSRENSINKIREIGNIEVIELDFLSISNKTPDEFLNWLVSEFQPVSISTGFNYTFGKNRQGDAQYLENNQQKYGYKYFCLPPVVMNSEVVSSTLIKEYLKKGDVEKANNLLGSRFLLEGTVIKGAQIGRALGFPTANIQYPNDIIKIPFGVYAGKISNYKAVINWGIKPTLNNTSKPIIEAYIIDYIDNLYGKNIKIEIINKIRDERKFNNLDELKSQIKKDIELCLKL